ncbi:hypothetical protein L9G74_08285 [Shewanella sp. C32]|uniref:Uncharacterized protein n=1 Tax=Shewanella electrica TaxID=515560 RepID=A0ABT2FJI2_9GAMM|nr:hypothetical protein [Shewanella electrica]MCH1924532.1 hypothetical protein [Shewanella electrica]MCS4556433.1 hypothetical protein [Shewanella electrica]
MPEIKMEYKNYINHSMVVVTITLFSFIHPVNSYALDTKFISQNSNISTTLSSKKEEVQHINISEEVILEKLIELKSNNDYLLKENQELKKLHDNNEVYQEELKRYKNSELTLQNELSNLRNRHDTPSWVEWIGILLACVAAIVTILGVFVAIFSFYGYKKIVDETKNIAEAKTEKTIPELLPELTKKELISLIEDGSFNDIIEEAVAKVTYRGIEYSTGNEE